MALTGALILVATFPLVDSGTVATAELAWLPSLGLDLQIRLDGLSWIFAFLVLAIGLLVVIYAHYYMSSRDPVPRFFSFLLASWLDAGWSVGPSHPAGFSGKDELFRSSDRLLAPQSQGPKLGAHGPDRYGCRWYPALGVFCLAHRRTTKRGGHCRAIKSSEQPLHAGALFVLIAPHQDAHSRFTSAAARDGRSDPVSAYLHSATMVKAGSSPHRLFPSSRAPTSGISSSALRAADIGLGAWAAVFQQTSRACWRTLHQPSGLITLL